MDYQVTYMQESVTAYNEMRVNLLERAKDEDEIARTAMKRVRRWNSRTERYEWRTVADEVARAAARNRAAAFREQADAVLTRTILIKAAVTELEFAKSATRKLFETLEEDIIDADRRHANRQQHATDLSDAYRNWIQGINSSFTDFIPTGGAGALFNALRNFNPRTGRWLELATQSELSLLEAIRESGVPFPDVWNDRDKLLFARRYIGKR